MIDNIPDVWVDAEGVGLEAVEVVEGGPRLQDQALGHPLGGLAGPLLLVPEHHTRRSRLGRESKKVNYHGSK